MKNIIYVLIIRILGFWVRYILKEKFYLKREISNNYSYWLIVIEFDVYNRFFFFIIVYRGV